MTRKYREYSKKIPQEIKDAIKGLHGQKERKYAILTLLIDERKLAYSEIQETLELRPQEMSDALKDLERAGLIVKEVHNGTDREYTSYYKETEFAKRILDGLYKATLPKYRNLNFPQFQEGAEHDDGSTNEGLPSQSLSMESRNYPEQPAD